MTELQEFAQTHPATRRSVRALTEAGYSTIEGLADELLDSELLGGAVHVLGLSGRRAFVPFLIRLVEADRERFSCIIAVARLGGERAYRSLSRWMRADDPGLRYEATYGMAHSGIDRAYTLLRDVAKDTTEYPEIRGEAIEGLAYRLHACDRRRGRAKSAVKLLLKLLKDPHPEVRFWACFAASGLDEAALVRQLESMTQDQGLPRGFWSVGLEAQDSLTILRGGTPPDRRGRSTGHYSWDPPLHTVP